MDHRGTAYAILDENGAEIGRRQYDAFGVILSETGTWPTDLAYQTNWQTVKIGSKWWGLSAARMYDFQTGRFTQRDIVNSQLIKEDLFGQGLGFYQNTSIGIEYLYSISGNLTTLGSSYLYAPNNTLISVDPYGLDEKCCVKSFEAPYNLTDTSIIRDGGELTNRFEVHAKFTRDVECCCSCCEYRQYVRGYGLRDGKKLPSSNINNKYQEDIGTGGPYGRRKPVGSGIYMDDWEYGDDYGDNRATGCEYNSIDNPGFPTIRSGHRYALRLEYIGQIIDVCNGDAPVETKKWTIRLKAVVP
jgi:hypothetical protein